MARGKAYAPETRAQAIDLAVELGLPEATVRMREVQPEIQKSTIARWCQKAGVVPKGADGQPTAATRAAQLRWRERRLALKHQLGELAEEAVARSLREVKGGGARNAKDLATTAAIALDKAELLDVHDDPAEHEHDQAATAAEVDQDEAAGLRLLPGGLADEGAA